MLAFRSLIDDWVDFLVDGWTPVICWAAMLRLIVRFLSRWSLEGFRSCLLEADDEDRYSDLKSALKLVGRQFRQAGSAFSSSVLWYGSHSSANESARSSTGCSSLLLLSRLFRHCSHRLALSIWSMNSRLFTLFKLLFLSLSRSFLLVDSSSGCCVLLGNVSCSLCFVSGVRLFFFNLLSNLLFFFALQSASGAAS